MKAPEAASSDPRETPATTSTPANENESHEDENHNSAPATIQHDNVDSTLPLSLPHSPALPTRAADERSSSSISSLSTVKSEDGLDAASTPARTSPTLRPAPQPSKKRRGSEAALHTPDAEHKANKKRKRGTSPPWHFPTAETTTLKTADGRRISARVNVGTPGLSESEDKDRNRNRGRSESLSQSVTASRSRPSSPPWKKFEAAGPSSIQVDGKRKSGRVNKELTDGPKRVSPRNKKQVDKLGEEKKHVDVKQESTKSMGTSNRKSLPETKKQVNGHLERHSTNTASAAKIAELQAQIAALQPTRSFPTPIKTEEPRVNGTKSRKTDASQERRPSSPPRRKLPRGSDVALSPGHGAKPAPRLRLKVGPRRVIEHPHPGARPPSPLLPPKPSIWQLIDELDIQELQAPYHESSRDIPSAEDFAVEAEKAALRESAMRQRLLKESQPGGILSKEQLSIYQDDRQPEPPQQYGHHDHLVAHALYLRKLQVQEKIQHRALAKKVAYEALDKWRAMNGPTAEDLIAEQNKNIELIRKQVVADMKAKWELVEAHVQELKKRAWDAEQERLRAEKLQQKLEWSENLLAKQRGEADSDDDMDDDSEDDEVSEADDEEDSEENMIDTESEKAEEEGEEQEDEGEMDEEALKAYLAQRQAEPPDKAAGDGEDQVEEDQVMEEALGATPKPEDDTDDVTNKEVDANSQTPDTAAPERRTTRGQEPEIAADENDVDDHLSSDESTDMDSEDYDSDEDMSSTGDELAEVDDNDGNEDEDVGRGLKNSLLGFYSAKDLLREKDGGLPTPMTSVENGGDNENPRSQSEARSDIQADAGAQAPADADGVRNELDAMVKQQESTPAPELDEKTDLMEVDEEIASSSPEPDESAITKSLVPSPTLLRGTLRSYQHAGLDWLASLYRNGTNGILADEMGLGKTIQTISLLAHLAEVHEVWETHLVVVPTSVILNWVSEFQKFLPGFRVLGYYGSAEERAFKRKGWTNDPHNEDKSKRGYNVVITSYNVAKQDINAIRGQQWHYLILDEAHNIRNFNSQGWQLLIRLRTRARLLLTGTPLQNDLAEVWSLLTFLTAGDEDKTHGELEEFLSHWKDPVKEIFDQGVQKISENAQRVVEQLHISLRPFLLRRKKIEVEKDLPKKTESVVVCKLSKRQRQLYQDYMGLAETKATLAKGSGMQAGAVLLSLRRVCNHPDLFDPRPIQTSFAMEHSPLERYNATDEVVRRLLGIKHSVPIKLMVARNSRLRRSEVTRSRSLAATTELQTQLDNAAVAATSQPDAATVAGARALQRLRNRQKRLDQLRASIEMTRSALEDEPFVPVDLRELVTVHRDREYTFATKEQPTAKSLRGWLPVSQRAMSFEHPVDWHLARESKLQQDVATLDRYAERMQDLVVRFACVPPAATVPILEYTIPRKVQDAIRSSPAYPAEEDFCHEARIRSSIAFPDKRLLIYDSGKLQRLTYLLRDLQSRGSRSLIFTQMTGTLNILEQFLNLLNLPYLRLDGSTPVERRQLYSAEFNRADSKYQCMILSSRAGGVGLNLTGASSVIFFDLDWNPQMDRQCMDRAHRIGQTRDVEVYKMVSEKTVEENILRRANQKSLLDETVIQGGHFTTEYQHKRFHEDSNEDDHDGVAAAVDRFLGQDEKSATKALASVEDKEDVQAAQQAGKEDRQDDVDFVERSFKGPSTANTPGPGALGPDEDEIEDERKGHVDLYMIRQMQVLLKDWVYVPPPVRRLDKHGRDPSHRPKKRR